MIEHVEGVEAYAIFDNVCQVELSMNADEFLMGWHAGLYDIEDLDSIPGLPAVLCCLPFAGDAAKRPPTDQI
jgi:hypothetical protein